MMQTYTMVLSAGGQWVLQVSGKFMRILSATSPVSVDFFSEGNEKGTADGVGVGFWSKPVRPFDTLTITSQVAQSVTVLIGDGEAGFDQVAVIGQVKTMNGEAQDKDVAMMMAAESLAGGAGAYSVIGIKANTSTIEVEKLMINHASSGKVSIGWADKLAFNTWLAGASTEVTAACGCVFGAASPASLFVPTGALHTTRPPLGADTMTFTLPGNGRYQVSHQVPWVLNAPTSEKMLVVCSETVNEVMSLECYFRKR